MNLIVYGHLNKPFAHSDDRCDDIFGYDLDTEAAINLIKGAMVAIRRYPLKERVFLLFDGGNLLSPEATKIILDEATKRATEFIDELLKEDAKKQTEQAERAKQRQSAIDLIAYERLKLQFEPQTTTTATQ
jgi:hypothetical protein